MRKTLTTVYHRYDDRHATDSIAISRYGNTQRTLGNLLRGYL